MYKRSKKIISRLLVLMMFLTVTFSNISGVKILASSTSNDRKIDVWDFGGGVPFSGDLYDNHITRTLLDESTTITSGSFANTDFGDLSIVSPTTSDRYYYSNSDGTAGKNSAGTSGYSSIAYPDGYTSSGGYYCNGTGGSGRRYLTISNVAAGDKISVYGGIHNTKDEEVHFVYLGAEGTQDDTSYFGQTFSGSDFVAKYSGKYQIYITTVNGGKPFYNGVIRTPGVKVSGQVNLNDNDVSLTTISFVNETTEDTVTVTVNADNSFDAVLPAGYEYTAVLDGVNGFAISDQSKVVTTAATDVPGGISNITFEVVSQSLASISGNITGFDSSYDVSKLQIKLLPPQGSLSPEVELTIDKEAMTYNANVRPGEAYSAVLSGVNDYTIVTGGAISVVEDATQDIQVATKAVYAATGSFLGLNSTAQVQSINFVNVDDGYTYEGTVANGGYTVSLRDGAYEVQAVVNENYVTTTHVVINGVNTTKDIKFSSTAAVEPLNRVADLYVGDDSKEYNYATVKEALAAAARMNPTSETERITIHIAPGVYRAQLTIATPYITLVNANPSEEVKITWYYGIGYKYYSLDANGYYNEDRAFDKYSKNTAAKWGGTVFLTSAATGFRAENIVFENSFSKYVTEEELEDGVQISSTDGSGIQVTRTLDLDVTAKSSTERAAAMLVEADNVEFNKCSFIGSQDTLYTGGSDQYYKDCFIEGNTDYIFGDGDAVFDNCELYFCGYSDQASGGYITAAKDSAVNGYLFINCTVTANPEKVQAPGFFGRPWGPKAKVKFINTKLESTSLINPQGWATMSSNTPENANFAEYNTTYNGAPVDTASRKGEVLSDSEAAAIDVTAYFGDWTPTYYTVESQEPFTVNSTFNMSSLQARRLLDVETVITNNNSSVDSVVVIVALYNGEGKMVNISYISKNIAIGSTDNLNAGFKLPSDVTNHIVKVMVWEGTSVTDTSLNPISNVVTLQ